MTVWISIFLVGVLASATAYATEAEPAQENSQRWC